MIDIVKNCESHGPLTIEDVSESTENNGISFRFKCKKCIQEKRLRNLEKERERGRIYEKTKRVRDKEKYAEYQRNYSRDWRRKNADAINEKIRTDRINNPQKYLNYEHKWRSENLEKARAIDVAAKFKMTYDEYKKMFESQNGLCAICGLAETK